MKKIRATLETLCFLVLIGVIILAITMIVQNFSTIVNQFVETPIEAIIVFASGALSLKAAQILRLFRARRIRAKKAEKARRRAAIATAKAKAKAESSEESASADKKSQ